MTNENVSLLRARTLFGCARVVFAGAGPVFAEDESEGAWLLAMSLWSRAISAYDRLRGMVDDLFPLVGVKIVVGRVARPTREEMVELKRWERFAVRR